MSQAHDISIIRINSVWSRVEADSGIVRELSDAFTFEVPGAKFMPSYRKKYWDGKIRLIKAGTNKVYSGLVHSIEEWATDHGYSFGTDLDFKTEPKPLSFNKWYASGNRIEPREYQAKAIYSAQKYKRAIFLSPTASGKSLIIYTIARNLLSKIDGKVLILVPTTSLVEQLYSDFQDYANGDWDVPSNCTRIYSGMPREDKRIVISTWQSLYDLPAKAFDPFGAVIGDECHLYKSKEISGLLEKMSFAEYRYGFTGTLDGSQTNKLILEGLFGKVIQVASTAQLVKDKHLAQFKINCIVIDHSNDEKIKNKDNNYEEEIQYIIGSKNRNRFLTDLARSTKGNTLVLFSRVETHGKIIYDMIKEATDREVYFIYGGTETYIREDVRKKVENAENAIIVASTQVFSTGINIKSLANIIFAYPSKSRVRTLQSIGRVLRLSEKKEISTIYDISDDLTWKDKKNYTYNHFVERLKIYTSEEFNYAIKKVRLEDLYGGNHLEL